MRFKKITCNDYIIKKKTMNSSQLRGEIERLEYLLSQQTAQEKKYREQKCDEEVQHALSVFRNAFNSGKSFWKTYFWPRPLKCIEGCESLHNYNSKHIVKALNQAYNKYFYFAQYGGDNDEIQVLPIDCDSTDFKCSNLDFSENL